MVTVKISEKGGQQSDYQFEKSEVSIGRMKGNDIVLPKGNVSKRHARMERRNDALMIEDLDSTNGTYVNGRKITGLQEITDNDKIYIGDFILQIEHEREGQPPKAPPQPPAGNEEKTESRDGDRRKSSPPPSPPNQGTGDSEAPARGGSSSGAGGGESGGRNRSKSPRPSGSDSPPTSPPTSDPKSRPNAGSEPPSTATPEQGSASATSRTGDPERASSSSAPSSPPARGGSGSSAGTSPDAERRSSGGRADSGRPSRDSAGTESSPAPDPTGDLPGGTSTDGSVADSDAGEDDRASEQSPGQSEPPSRPRHPVGPPISRRDLDSKFDESFARAKEDVAEVLLEEPGLDAFPDEYPAADPAAATVENQVADIVDELAPDVDRDRLIDALVSECVGLGPIERYLDTPGVRGIFVNRHDRIVLHHGDRRTVADEAFAHPDLLDLVTRRLVGSDDDGYVTADLGDGTTLEALLPPLAPAGPRLAIRRSPSSPPSLERLADEDALTESMGMFLERAVESGRSILVAGPSPEPRHRLLRALARAIPEGSRVVSISTSRPLELPQPTAIALEGSGPQASAGELLGAASAMSPDRVVLDACEGPTALDWTRLSANDAHGSLTTTGGLDAAQALGQFETAIALDHPRGTVPGLREQIARAVDLVAVVDRRSETGLRVGQIAALRGADADGFDLRDVFRVDGEGAERGCEPTGYIPPFYEDLRRFGADVDFDIFEA